MSCLLGVALALWGSVQVAEHGRRRDYLLAGAGAGLGPGFMYTAGLALLPLGIAEASGCATSGGGRSCCWAAAWARRLWCSWP